MTKTELIALCGGTQVALARLAGRTKQAVSKWGEVIPVEAAREIEINSGGRFRAIDIRPDFFGPLEQQDTAPREAA